MKKEEWRQSWLRSINELTSLSLQRTSWIGNKTNPHWSFIEFTCCYFDNVLVHDYSHFIKESWITTKEFEIIENWHNKLTKYNSPNNDDYNHEAILSDLQWIEIVKTGALAKEELFQIIDDKEQLLLSNS
jgi:hypothetical protein